MLRQPARYQARPMLWSGVSQPFASSSPDVQAGPASENRSASVYGGHLSAPRPRLFADKRTRGRPRAPPLKSSAFLAESDAPRRSVSLPPRDRAAAAQILEHPRRIETSVVLANSRWKS